jgi:O-antigen ligase
VVSITATTFFFSHSGAILGLLGRDTTLTGRSDIWDAVSSKIQERLWLGFGYGGFWTGEDGESASIWQIVGWQVPHAHNGFLDLTLDLGLIGLIVFVMGFGITLAKAINYARLTKTLEGLFPLVFLTFMILANLTETALIKPGIIWLFYVVVTLSLENQQECLPKSRRFQHLKTKNEVAPLKA